MTPDQLGWIGMIGIYYWGGFNQEGTFTKIGDVLNWWMDKRSYLITFSTNDSWIGGRRRWQCCCNIFVVADAIQMGCSSEAVSKMILMVSAGVYSSLVWTRTMHQWPLAMYRQLGFSGKRFPHFKYCRTKRESSLLFLRINCKKD